MVLQIFVIYHNYEDDKNNNVDLKIFFSYHNYEDDDAGFEKKPPSYTSEEKNYERDYDRDYDQDRDYDRDRPVEKEYEDYNRHPSDSYDPEFESGEPNKFDRNGKPRELYDRSNHSQDDYHDDRYRPREDDYDRHDDDYDDRYDRRDPRDDRYDDRYEPSVASSKSGSTAKPSSTFV